jgi:hypothetical protein
LQRRRATKMDKATKKEWRKSKEEKNICVNIHIHTQGVSKRALQWYFKYYCVASVTKMFTLKGVQTIHFSTSWGTDSLYAFMCKRFCNTRHTAVTLGIPLQSSFSITEHYHWTVSIPGKTRCVLLH